MKIKGIKKESLDKIINSFYQEHKEVIDVWQELMIAAQTDIEINSPEQPEVIPNPEVPELVEAPIEVVEVKK